MNRNVATAVCLTWFIIAVLVTQWFPQPFHYDVYYYGFPVLYGSRSAIERYIDDLTYIPAGITWLSHSFQWEITIEDIALNVVFVLVSACGTGNVSKYIASCPLRFGVKDTFVIVTVFSVFFCVSIYRDRVFWEVLWCLAVTTLVCMFAAGLNCLCALVPRAFVARTEGPSFLAESTCRMHAAATPNCTGARDPKDDPPSRTPAT